MRYGIFSDIHSNLEALGCVLEAYKKESIDKLYCCGDIVGYGADPNECIRKIRESVDIVIAGNHDWASAGLFSEENFNSAAKKAIIWTRKAIGSKEVDYLKAMPLFFKTQDLILVHATLDNPQDFNYLTDEHDAQVTFRLMEENLCFLGHTHIPEIFVRDSDSKIERQEVIRIKIEDNKKYIINVGSVGQPRDGNPQTSYCIYDSEKKEVFIKRKPYAIETTRQKILQEGLPVFLAERLLSDR